MDYFCEKEKRTSSWNPTRPRHVHLLRLSSRSMELGSEDEAVAEHIDVAGVAELVALMAGLDAVGAEDSRAEEAAGHAVEGVALGEGGAGLLGDAAAGAGPSSSSSFL